MSNMQYGLPITTPDFSNWGQGATINNSAAQMTNQLSGFTPIQQPTFNLPITSSNVPVNQGGGFLQGLQSLNPLNAFSGFGDWAKSDSGKFWLGGVNEQGVKNSGFLSDAFGIGSQVAGAWTGMKQLDLAKKQFNLQKDLMNKNYAAQRGLTNTRLRDRQNARNAADSNFYQDTSSYMKENEVK